MLGAARCIFMAVQAKPSAGRIKDGTPTDDAVPAGFASAVVDHAASGDGVADDTTELNAALGGATSIWMAPGEEHRITGSVDAAGGNHLIFNGARILFDRPANDVYALDLGGGNRQGRLVQGVRVVNQNQSDWSNPDNAGVRLRELDNSNFEVYEASGFAAGIRLRADNSNCAYNVGWHLGEIKNCRYGIWINEDDPNGGNPWANSNGFLGGRIVVEPGVNTSTDRYGIYVNAHDGVVNHIKFLGPSFDLAEDGTGDAVVMYWHGQTLGIIWYSVENTNDERVADGANTVAGGAFGAWTEDWGADTQRKIPAQIEINNTREQQWAVDLRRLTDGAAANNIENAGGVID